MPTTTRPRTAPLDAHPEAWGVWRIPERDVAALGDVAGADVLEYGCGAAQWSLALSRRGRAASRSTSRARSSVTPRSFGAQ